MVSESNTDEESTKSHIALILYLITYFMVCGKRVENVMEMHMFIISTVSTF